METFMLTGFKFESPQQYWIPDNHFMRLNVSCLLTAQRDFSYFETFWSEFKPENGQLVQNKADTKAYVGVFFILFSVRFLLKLALYFSCTWVVFPWQKEYLYGGRQAYTGGFPSCRHNFKVELWSVGTPLGGSPQLLHSLVSNIIILSIAALSSN